MTDAADDDAKQESSAGAVRTHAFTPSVENPPCCKRMTWSIRPTRIARAERQPSRTPTPVIKAGVVTVGAIEGDTCPAVAVGAANFASPKSSTFTVPSSRTLMFAGFRSR